MRRSVGGNPGSAAGTTNVSRSSGKGRTVVIGAFGFELDAGVHQMHLDILGAVREQMQLDIGVLGGRAAQHRSDQMRTEVGQTCHHAGGSTPQGREQRGMRLCGKEPQVPTQFVFDLGVVRQQAPGRGIAEQVMQRTSLGLSVVATFFRDEAGGRSGQFGSKRFIA